MDTDQLVMTGFIISFVIAVMLVLIISMEEHGSRLHEETFTQSKLIIRTIILAALFLWTLDGIALITTWFFGKPLFMDMTRELYKGIIKWIQS